MLKIKRYSNRKLYLEGKGKYITLKDVVTLIKQGNQIEVYDNVKRQDITNEVLHKVLTYVRLENENIYNLIQKGDN